MGRWASLKAKRTFVEPFTAWGVADASGGLIAAFVWNDHADGNVELSYVGTGGFTKDNCAALAKFAFDELNCRRVTIRTRLSNHKLIAQAKWFGFRREGLHDGWYEDEPAVTLGMVKGRCPVSLRRGDRHLPTERSCDPSS